SHAPPCAPDSRRLRAPLRARCAVLRSRAPLGAHPDTGAALERPALASGELQPTRARSAGHERVAPDRRICMGGAMRGRGGAVSAVLRASVLRRELKTAAHIPYTAQ